MIGQRTKIRLTVVLLLVLAIGVAFLDFPQGFSRIGVNTPSIVNNLPYHLGLDLQGGTHLIYEADVSHIPSNEQQDAIEGVRDVIERRVNAFGVAEPLIQTTQTAHGWRIIAELAGVQDVNEAIAMIGETPLLEFREVNPNPQTELTEEQQKELDDYNADALQRAEEITQLALSPGQDFATLANDVSEDPGNLQKTGGDLGMKPRGYFVPEFEESCFDVLSVGEITAQPVESQFGYHIIKKVDEIGEGDSKNAQCSHILIAKLQPESVLPVDANWKYTGLTGTQLAHAQVLFNQYTQAPEVGLSFDSEGATLFEEITARNIGKPVAIFLDGQPISTPTVQNAIAQGEAVISGNFTVQEARLLAQRLNAGALPVPIELISQQTVGATLGNTSVQKSLQAALLGLLLVAIFMIGYYRLPGFAAVLALLIYGLLVLLIFKLIPVTLTLAGLAGFVLSIGMAVDANVLIFERMKEELVNGKNLDVAIKNGFKRAWPSIYDGNVSTILTCLILMGFTTSLIKGFAITLTIGVLCSMFSAMVITRILIDFLAHISFLRSPRLYGGKKSSAESQ